MPINPNSNDTLLIDESTLKEYSVINDNVDVKILTPLILKVQDLYMTKILGTSLLVDLQNKIHNEYINDTVSGSTLTPILTSYDKDLMNVYLRKLMVYLVQQEVPVFLTYKYLNKGVSTQSSSDSQPVTDQQIQRLVNNAKVAADEYAQRTIAYLKANISLYPAYRQTTSFDDVYPSNTGYKPSFKISRSGNGNERHYFGNGYYRRNYFS